MYKGHKSPSLNTSLLGVSMKIYRRKLKGGGAATEKWVLLADDISYVAGSLSACLFARGLGQGTLEFTETRFIGG